MVNLYNIFNRFYNNPSEGNVKHRNLLALTFVPTTLIVVILDSTTFAATYFDARFLSSLVVVSYFFFMLTKVDSRLRRLMIMMVPLSYLGEVFFCYGLEMYAYRLDYIPLYIPFGHAVVYGSGYVLSDCQWAKNKNDIMKKIFFIFYISIFLIASMVFNDILTLILGLLFFRSLYRHQWNNLYYYVGILALIVEYSGTYFNAWQWETNVFGLIPSLSPPVGAVFFYVGGDTLLLRVMRYLEKKNIFSPIDFKRPPENWKF